MQFKEHLPYSYGDDLRSLDWKILAKTGEAYVKKYEEERELEIVVIIDATASMHMGYKGISKLQAAIEICCLFYLLTIQTKDKIHPMLALKSILNLNSGSGRQGLEQFIAALFKHQVLGEKVLIEDIFSYHKLWELLGRKNKQVILISDLYSSGTLENLKKYFNLPNFYIIRVASPFDIEEKIAFSFPLKAMHAIDSVANMQEKLTSKRNSLYSGKNPNNKFFRNLTANNLITLNLKDEYLYKLVATLTKITLVFTFICSVYFPAYVEGKELLNGRIKEIDRINTKRPINIGWEKEVRNIGPGDFLDLIIEFNIEFNSLGDLYEKYRKKLPSEEDFLKSFEKDLFLNSFYVLGIKLSSWRGKNLEKLQIKLSGMLVKKLSEKEWQNLYNQSYSISLDNAELIREGPVSGLNSGRQASNWIILNADTDQFKSLLSPLEIDQEKWSKAINIGHLVLTLITLLISILICICISI